MPRWPERTVEQRFMDKVVVDESSGCWLWQGSRKKDTGYGRFSIRAGESYMAHRWSYEHFVGPIPEGHWIDHVRTRGCVHRHCVNPDHLEPTLPRENIMRSDRTIAAINAAKTSCAHCGGPLEFFSGSRRCRPCTREQKNEWQRARRAA